jgi:hypothetical protein
MQQPAISFEDIRIACGYAKRDNLRQILTRLEYPADVDWNEPRQADEILPLLRILAKPRPNKDQKVLSGAASLIERIVSYKHEALPIEPPQPIEEPTRVAEVVRGGPSFSLSVFRGLTELDIAYYFCIGATIYSLLYVIKDMAFFVGPVYFLISRHALRMTKDRHSKRTASSGVAMVWALEAIALFVHWNMFNLRLWGSKEDLALDWETYPSAIFVVAGVLSVMLAGGGVYAVSTSLALNKERDEAEAFEAQYDGQRW